MSNSKETEECEILCDRDLEDLLGLAWACKGKEFDALTEDEKISLRENDALVRAFLIRVGNRLAPDTTSAVVAAHQARLKLFASMAHACTSCIFRSTAKRRMWKGQYPLVWLFAAVCDGLEAAGRVENKTHFIVEYGYQLQSQGGPPSNPTKELAERQLVRDACMLTARNTPTRKYQCKERCELLFFVEITPSNRVAAKFLELSPNHPERAKPAYSSFNRLAEECRHKRLQYVMEIETKRTANEI